MCHDLAQWSLTFVPKLLIQHVMSLDDFLFHAEVLDDLGSDSDNDSDDDSSTTEEHYYVSTSGKEESVKSSHTDKVEQAKSGNNNSKLVWLAIIPIAIIVCMILVMRSCNDHNTDDYTSTNDSIIFYDESIEDSYESPDLDDSTSYNYSNYSSPSHSHYGHSSSYYYDDDDYEEKYYDSEGYDKDGYDRDGYDEDGYDDWGIDDEGYDEEGNYHDDW